MRHAVPSGSEVGVRDLGAQEWGAKGPRRRRRRRQDALPSTRQETGFKCPEGCATREGSSFGAEPGRSLQASERTGEGRREGGPYLVLGVLEHVAHAALVLLEAEEDIPQPQGGQEHHEDVERQVPEVDGVEKHGAAELPPPLLRLQGAREPRQTERGKDARAKPCPAEQRAPARSPPALSPPPPAPPPPSPAPALPPSLPPAQRACAQPARGTAHGGGSWRRLQRECERAPGKME